MTHGHKIDPDHFSSRKSLGCPKKRDITFNFHSFSNFEKSLQNDASVKGHTIKTLVKAQKKKHFSLFCYLIREIKS